jgi:hypothetical protein
LRTLPIRALLQFPANRCRQSLRSFYTLLLPIPCRTSVILILFLLSLTPTPAHDTLSTFLKYCHTPSYIFRRRIVILIAHSLSFTPTPTHDSVPTLEVSLRSFAHSPSQARRPNHPISITNSFNHTRSCWYASQYRHARFRPFRYSFHLKDYRYNLTDTGLMPPPKKTLSNQHTFPSHGSCNRLFD